MHPALEILEEIPTLRDPVLISGLAVRRRAGRLPSQAVMFLVDAWKARHVARIDSDAFLDFTVRRPEVRYSGDERIIEPPDTNIYLASPPGAERDFLLITGFEPNWQWRTFAGIVADYADAAGAKTLVSFRCFPGQVPHTRPAPVTINSSDVQLELQFGVQAVSFKYTGPTDIMSVIAAQVQTKRWQTVDLTVLQPYYFPRMPNAKATIALVRAIDRAFGTRTPIESLESEAVTQAQLIDESTNGSSEEAEALRELEENYDTGHEQMNFLSPGDDGASELPSGEEVIREIERLFGEPRKQED